MQHGQSSLEYVTTYGWAFLVILVAIGALSYFGVISPSNWLPEQCDFGQQLECVDWQVVSGGGGQISLYIRNNFGATIEITDGEYRTDTGIYLGDFPTGTITLLPGEANTTYITNVDEYLFQGEKQHFSLRYTFRKQGSSNDHYVTGTLYAKVN